MIRLWCSWDFNGSAGATFDRVELGVAEFQLVELLAGNVELLLRDGSDVATAGAEKVAGGNEVVEALRTGAGEFDGFKQWRGTFAASARGFL